MRQPLLFAIAVLSLLVSRGLAEPDKKAERILRQKVESFDKDPMWDGHNNRVKVENPNPVVQDFGYSESNHAEGKGSGEIGGRVQRSTTPAFYGKRLVQARSFEHRLHCSGTFAVTQTTGASSLYFGWFNTKTMEVRPRNWMGLYINGEGNGCEISFGYNTATGRSDGLRATGVGSRGAAVRDFNRIPTNTPYTFDFLYEPDAGDGNGQITLILGGKGPFTGGPIIFKVPAEHRKAGVTFNAFGIINQQSAGSTLSIYFDDISIDGEAESFGNDPQWLGQGNRDRYDDYLLEGAHQFGFSPTQFAGGQKKGEIGGLVYSTEVFPGYYADHVGRLTLEDRLVASGKVSLKMYGHDAGLYLGWFNSRKRGWPPENILGVLIDGSTGAGPRFRSCVASADPNQAHSQWETSPPLPPDGGSHACKIDYDPAADGGQGRLTVSVDQRTDSFTLSPAVRKQGATFDRFGLFVQENGGRVLRVYFDDLEYTTTKARPDMSVRTLEGHTSSVMAAAFSPDGKVLATGSRDGSIRVWDTKTWQIERTIKEHDGDVYSVVFSPKGDLMVSAGKDKKIRLWSVGTKALLSTLEGHTDIVRAVAFSPDQKTLASVSVDTTVKLWDVETGGLKTTLEGHTARVKSVVYSPDGLWIATAASDKTIRVWDTQSGNEMARMEGHTSDIETLALSPDGRLLASSSNDTTVRIWDMATKKTVKILQGHTAEVDSVEFSSDGKTVASGGKDTFIKLWDVKTGKLLRTLSGHTGRVESLTFSRDDKILGTGGGGGDSGVKLWDLTKE